MCKYVCSYVVVFAPNLVCFEMLMLAASCYPSACSHVGRNTEYVTSFSSLISNSVFGFIVNMWDTYICLLRWSLENAIKRNYEGSLIEQICSVYTKTH